MTDKLVYGVVLAWNHIADTIETLESLLASDYAALRLLLVDNASTDDTLKVMAERFPQVEVLASPKNLGVSGGYNLGMAAAVAHGAEYVLIANNDIHVEPGMVSALVQMLEAHPQAGMAMPKIVLYADPKRLWTTGGRWRRFPPMVKMTGYNAPDSPAQNLPRPIDFAPSCVLLLRAETIRQVGDFDTGYFFYYDDWDYCLRCRKAGYEIWYTPQAVMRHKVSVSTQKSDKPAIWWTYYGRSTVRLYRKHSHGAALNLFCVWFTLRELLKGNFKRIQPFWQGVRLERSQPCPADPVERK